MMPQYPGALIAQDQFSRERSGTMRFPFPHIDPPVVEGKAMEYVIHPPDTPARQRRLRDIVALHQCACTRLIFADNC
jgi:hypothetical protein